MYVILLIFNSLVYNIPAFAHSTYQTYKCNKGWITFCRCFSRLFATCGNFFPYMLQNGTRNLRNQHTYMYCVRWFIHLVIFSEPFRTCCMVWGFPLLKIVWQLLDVYSWSVQFGDGMVSPWLLFHIRSFSYVHVVVYIAGRHTLQ